MMHRYGSTTRPGWPRSIVLGCLVAVALAASSAFAASLAAPVNTARPTIGGTVREGETLTAQNGTWQNSPTSFRYRWQRCDPDGTGCVSLVGETERTYTLDANDVGKRIRVLVTAVNADGDTTATADPTTAVASSSAPRNTARPAISGTAHVGEELVADAGSWSGSPDRFAFQWQRCTTAGTGCADVSGATGKTYGVRSVDMGSLLRVVVQATNAAGSASSESNLTDEVVRSAPVAGNERPRIVILSARVVGPRTSARFRVCDDSSKKVTILQTDSRPGVLSYTRRFSTPRPPVTCAVYSRTWLRVPRFRNDGRYIVILRARDTSGLTSAAATRTFFL